LVSQQDTSQDGGGGGMARLLAGIA